MSDLARIQEALANRALPATVYALIADTPVSPMGRAIDGDPPKITHPSQDYTLSDRLRDDQDAARRLK